MISLTCGILKDGTNEFIHQTEPDSQTYKTNYGYQRGKVGGGINEEIGIKKKITTWSKGISSNFYFHLHILKICE